MGDSEKCALDMSSYEDLHSSIARNVGSDGDVKEDYVFVENNDVVLLNDNAKNRENVAESSVVAEDCDNVRDRLEDEVKVNVDETGMGDENGVNEVEENREVRSGSENADVSGRVVVVKENSDREINVDEMKEGSEREPNLGEVEEGSGRAPTLNLDGVKEGSDRDAKPDEVEECSSQEPTLALDEVKDGSDREPNLDEVEEGSGRAPTLNLDGFKEGSDRDTKLDEVEECSGREPTLALDEVKEGSDRDPMLDEVKEGSVSKPGVEEVKEADLGFATSDSGYVYVGIGSLSSDAERNANDSVSDIRESARTEDSTCVTSVPDAAEHYDIKEAESGFDASYNGIVSGDGVGPRSLGVSHAAESSMIKEAEVRFEKTDNDNVSGKDNVSDAHEYSEVAAEDIVVVNRVPDVPEPSEVDVQMDSATAEVSEGKLVTDQQIVRPLVNEFEIHEGEVALIENKVDDRIKSSVSEFESGQSQKASPEEDVVQDQVAERAGSFDVLDKDLASVDCTADETLMVDDRTELPKLKSTDASPVDAEKCDLSYSHTKDIVSENGAVTASYEPTPRDSKIEDERGLVDAVSSAASDSRRRSAYDTCSQSATMNSQRDAAVKSNNVSDGTLRPNISFGSFGSSSPLSRTDIELRSGTLNKSTPLNMSSPKTKPYSANCVMSLSSHANGDHSGSDHDTTACIELIRPEQTTELSVAPVEGSDAQKDNPDFARRHFYWLIKVPKGDEGKYRELLRESEIELAEKTKTRNAFQAEFTKHQVYCRKLRSTLEAASLEARAAFGLMRAKQREVDSGQHLLNLARRGVTVEDLDNQRLNLEHKLQHETHTLRAERELVREIRELNHQRQQLSADPQRQQEVQQALNQRDQTVEQMKVLKKEMEVLRDNSSKADEQVKAAQKKYKDEHGMLDNLKRQVLTANDIRQEAFARAMMLKKQQYQKSAPFYQAKNDLRVAYNYAAAGNKDSLERHCINQVEKVMELWNKNDEFRKEYIECNKRRMLWKFGTSDGTRLGINEMPPSMEDICGNRVRISPQINSPAAISPQIISPTAVLPVQKELPVEAKIAQDKITVKKNEHISKNSIPIVSRSVEIKEDKEEPKPTKEEEELARKAEQLRREEEAARLREQRKLEEKAKAEEALERKRRNALKAQARAEFKARKEAEEKEIRAKKKQLKDISVNTTVFETGQPSEPSSESLDEPEVAEKPATTAKRLKNASLYTKQIKTGKSIPPALRNKGKRGLLRYWPYACMVLLAIGLFYLGSLERIQAITQVISGLLHR